MRGHEYYPIVQREHRGHCSRSIARVVRPHIRWMSGAFPLPVSTCAAPSAVRPSRSTDPGTRPRRWSVRARPRWDRCPTRSEQGQRTAYTSPRWWGWRPARPVSACHELSRHQRPRAPSPRCRVLPDRRQNPRRATPRRRVLRQPPHQEMSLVRCALRRSVWRHQPLDPR